MKWSDNLSICHSILIEDPATLSTFLMKKFWCVSVTTAEKIATCKLLESLSHIEYHKFVFSFDGDSFENAGSSKCDHDYTYGLAVYRGKALTTGSYLNSDCNVRTEIYDFETNQWSDAADYPFGR